MTAALSPLRLTGVGVAVVLAATAVLGVRALTADSEDAVGSGIAADSVRSLPTFSGVTLKAANDVRIHVGRAQRVTVYGDDNLLELVTTRVENGQLVIGARRGFMTTTPMRVDVSTPTLDTITLTGSGVMRAEGSTPQAVATLAGAGRLQLAPLIARHVVAVLAGAGRIDVTATESLTAELVGSGAIVYSGDPAHVTTNVEGTGTVAPR
jgi:hypothetical protein